ncbi:hypothetical protein BJ742DRAFT_192520 [Cladochytrium replicatum]|nr:hypothetical protein BJ742DRAFT_192520 [Cladochytrium replicatum]
MTSSHMIPCHNLQTHVPKQPYAVPTLHCTICLHHHRIMASELSLPKRTTSLRQSPDSLKVTAEHASSSSGFPALSTLLSPVLQLGFSANSSSGRGVRQRSSVISLTKKNSEVLVEAAAEGGVNAVQYMLKNGADPTFVQPWKESADTIWASLGLTSTAIASLPYSSLPVACLHGHIEVVRTLLPHILKERAPENSALDKLPESIQFLLSASVFMSTVAERSDILQLLFNESEKLVSAATLIELGAVADLNPVKWAAKMNAEILDVLLCRSGFGLSESIINAALIEASSSGNSRGVELLTLRGANPRFSEYASMIAAVRGEKWEVLRSLIDHCELHRVESPIPEKLSQKGSSIESAQLKPITSITPEVANPRVADSEPVGIDANRNVLPSHTRESISLSPMIEPSITARHLYPPYPAFSLTPMHFDNDIVNRTEPSEDDQEDSHLSILGDSTNDSLCFTPTDIGSIPNSPYLVGEDHSETDDFTVL